MEFIKKYKDQYEIRALTSAEFYPLLEVHGKTFFDDNNQVFAWQSVASDEEKQKFAQLREKLKGRYTYHLGVYLADQLVGWSSGFQETEESFYMMNSAVFPEHRLQGIYTELANLMIQQAVLQGFQKIYSRHIMANNAILISKLKLGFKITSFEVSDRFGVLVHLSYFPMKARQKVLDYRTGFIKPDTEIKQWMKLD